MNISEKAINDLQPLLEEQLGHVCTHDELQRAGFAVLRYVLIKEIHGAQINFKKRKKDNE